MPDVITAKPIDIPISQDRNSNILSGREYLSTRGRLAWLAVGLCCGGVLGVGAWLRPDARGYGTHEALGIPPCSFMLNTGLPCPTCGMTTAFSLLLHGHPAKSFMVQPAGFAMCIGALALMVIAFHAAARGYFVQPNWARLGPVRVSISLGLLLLGGWGFKMAMGLWTGALPVRY